MKKRDLSTLLRAVLGVRIIAVLCLKLLAEIFADHNTISAVSAVAMHR